MNPNYNPNSIEEELLTAIKTLNLSSYYYLGARPVATIATEKPNFCVVRASTGITDLNAYGETITSIDLYAKALGNEKLRDSKKLSEMVSKLMDAVVINTPHYKFSYSNLTPSIADGSGYFLQIFSLRTLIH